MEYRKKILVVSAISVGYAAAQTQYGYSDNYCGISSVSFSFGETTPESPMNNPIASSVVTKSYRLACVDGEVIQFELQSEIAGMVGTSATYNTATNTYAVDGWRYGPDSEGWYWPPEGGNYYHWPVSATFNDDVSLVHAEVFKHWDAKSTAQLPKSQIEKWDRWQAAGEAATQFSEYNPSRFRVDPVFNREYPAFPFNHSSTSKDRTTGGVPRSMWKVSYLDNPAYFAKVYCFPGATDADYFNKPLVVGDAFDPFSERTGKAVYFAKQYSELLKTGSGAPRGRGYDVFFVDFSQGGGNLHINAMLTLKLYEYLGTRTQGRMIVGGLSMGGILARLALLYSMPSNNTTRTDLGRKVKGYISVDSPHQGANVAPDVMKDIYSLLSSGWVQLSDEKFQLREYRDQLNTPAAHQMLYEHYYLAADVNSTEVDGIVYEEIWPGVRTDAHASFYNFLAAKGGYKPGVPKIAIAYSNFQKPHPGYDGPYNAIVNRMGNSSIWRRNLGNSLEFLPGSTGYWYYSSYEGKNNDNMTPERFPSGGPKFMGTFLPIVSALDLRDFDSMSPPTQDPAALKRYSPFDAVYYMTNGYNGYCNASSVCKNHSLFEAGTHRTTNDDKRYEHLVMDKQLLTAIMTGLDKLEKLHAAKILPTVLTLLGY